MSNLPRNGLLWYLMYSSSPEVPNSWLSIFLEDRSQQDPGAWLTNYCVRSLLCKQSGLMIIRVSWYFKDLWRSGRKRKKNRKRGRQLASWNPLNLYLKAKPNKNKSQTTTTPLSQLLRRYLLCPSTHRGFVSCLYLAVANVTGNTKSVPGQPLWIPSSKSWEEGKRELLNAKQQMGF